MLAHMTAWLKATGKSVATQASAAYAKFAKAQDDDQRTDEIIAALEIEWEQLGYTVTDFLKAAAIAGVDVGQSQVAVMTHGDPMAAKSRALAYAEDRGAELVGMKRQPDGSFVENPDAQWAISETTREDLRNTIAQAFEEGWNPSQLAAVIEGSQTFSSARSDLIAKTEITRAQAQGNLGSWISSGVILAVQWQTSADHECCDECDLFEEQGEVEPGHEFAPGVTAPGAHPRCNCALVVRKVKK